MTNQQMAIIPKKAFAFCRFTICILFWLTSILLFFGIKWMIFMIRRLKKNNTLKVLLIRIDYYLFFFYVIMSIVRWCKYGWYKNN